MNSVSAEATRLHTLLIQCTLQIDESRSYWRHAVGDAEPDLLRRAFEEYWFGARSLPYVKRLVANLRARFDAFPAALKVLHGWREMTPETRRVICHWHLQLADPLYRNFTGSYLVERRDGQRVDVSRDLVTRWVEEQAAGRWRLTTCIQFASKLLSSAFSAGLVATNRDPRPLRLPMVDDLALTYLMYLLREVSFAGTLLENPYLASVGLRDDVLERRLKRLTALRFRRQADLTDFDWQFESLTHWAESTVCCPESVLLRGAS